MDAFKISRKRRYIYIKRKKTFIKNYVIERLLDIIHQVGKDVHDRVKREKILLTIRNELLFLAKEI